jgi:hypothetical protein
LEGLRRIFKYEPFSILLILFNSFQVEQAQTDMDFAEPVTKDGDCIYAREKVKKSVDCEPKK